MKHLFLLAAVLLAGTTLCAQSNWTVGVKGGLLSSSYWTSDEGNRPLHRPQAGVLLAYAVGPRWTLRTELNYAPKGDRWYFDYESGAREHLRDVYHYLEIPLLAQYQVCTCYGARLYLNGGLYGARALANYYTEGNETRRFEQFTRSDFGLQLGGGAAVPWQSGQFFAEMRWSQGFKNLDVFGDGITTTRNQAFGLTAGYRVAL
jgi:hypothetical protein